MKRKSARLIRSLFIVLSLTAVAAAIGCSGKPSLKAVKVAHADVEATITTTTAGTVDAQQQAVLAFGAVGRVDRILARAGQIVRKGQLLAQMENRDLLTIFQNAEKDLERSRELFKEGLISRAALDEASRGFQVARSNLDKTEIRAPFDGIITDMNLSIGELSQPQFPADKPPMRIVDQKPRLIKGMIDEVDLSKVKPGSLARVKIPAVRTQPFMAKVVRVVPYVSTTKEQERTAQIELEIDAAEPNTAIPVGASAEIEVIIQSKKDAVAVPSRAVLGTGDSRYVFLFDDGRIKKTNIKSGVGNYDRTEVLSGIQLDDVIVLPGDIELKDQMKAKVSVAPWP